MKILIDIGHPGHVHYFKNLIKELYHNNHSVLITARDRGIIIDLLEKYNLPYVNRGKGKDSKLGKLTYMVYADFKLLKCALKFKPDIFLSFSSPYASQVAWLLRKPSIVINDTEHTDAIHAKFTYPFSTTILTPYCYYNDLGSKHIKFNSFVENLYLNNKYFQLTETRSLLNLNENEEYVVIRFVSWKAHHDYGQGGLTEKVKRSIVKLLSTKYKVFISSEEELPNDLKEYGIKISSDMMHSVLEGASLFIGESATMASESCILGTKAIYINSLPLMGYLQELQKFGILTYFTSSEGVVDYIEELLITSQSKSNCKSLTLKLQSNFINPTDFLFWFLNDYPKSIEILKNDNTFQNRF